MSFWKGILLKDMWKISTLHYTKLNVVIHDIADILQKYHDLGNINIKDIAKILECLDTKEHLDPTSRLYSPLTEIVDLLLRNELTTLEATLIFEALKSRQSLNSKIALDLYIGRYRQLLDAEGLVFKEVIASREVKFGEFI